MGWFDLWSRPKPDLETKIIEFGRTRFDDIEDDIKGLKSSLQTFIEDTEKALKKLKERVGSLEEKGEWKPRFGDRVRFRHSFFGEMEGIFLEAVFPERWSLMFHDPSCGGSLKHYIVDKKDVEKCND
jgi:hypothetical protein